MQECKWPQNWGSKCAAWVCNVIFMYLFPNYPFYGYVDKLFARMMLKGKSFQLFVESIVPKTLVSIEAFTQQLIQRIQTYWLERWYKNQDVLLADVLPGLNPVPHLPSKFFQEWRIKNNLSATRLWPKEEKKEKKKKCFCFHWAFPGAPESPSRPQFLQP